jgi:predicted DNA-binding transcriptional regulator AlpA
MVFLNRQHIYKETIVFEAYDRVGLAKYLNTSLRYIEDLDAKRKGPPRIKLAGRWRYPKSDVEKWLKARIEIQCNATKR